MTKAVSHTFATAAIALGLIVFPASTVYGPESSNAFEVAPEPVYVTASSGGIL